MTNPAIEYDYDGAEIRRLRKARGMSLKALGDKAGIKGSSLWVLENQVTKLPKAKTLHGIAAALGVPYEAILKNKKRPAGEDLPGKMSALFALLNTKEKQSLIAMIEVLINQKNAKE